MNEALSTKPFQPASSEVTEHESMPWEQGWLDASGFSAYLLSQCAKVAPFRGSRALGRMKELTAEQALSSQQLLMMLASEFTLQPLDVNTYQRRDLSKIIPLVYACREDQFLPAIRFPQLVNPSNTPDDVKLFFISRNY